MSFKLKEELYVEAYGIYFHQPGVVFTILSSALLCASHSFC